MSDVVIKIEELYKEYQLGVIGHGTLYRDLQSWWAKKLGKEDPNSLINSENKDDGNNNILALKNINFEVNKGEILGIIGSNGAGKSTLLKILSRVTTPTFGRINVKGRIASLLEVGTGFHTELTGRENIFLNGAINGLDNKTILTKIDDIINFSGVGKFIDTPVKRYSSGMYVRLGFAVAAFLDPDILVIDEVLAVGDFSFQKKAIGKIQNISTKNKKTVLFVSHNMASIKNICTKAILLHKGQVVEYGDTEKVINKYLGIGKMNTISEKIWLEKSDTNNPKNIIPGNELAELKSIKILDDNSENRLEFLMQESIIIQLEYKFFRQAQIFDLSFHIRNERNELVCVMHDHIIYNQNGAREEGDYISTCTIPKNFLNDGQYFVTILVQEENIVHIREKDIVSFFVKDNMDKNSVRGNYRPNKAWPRAAVRVQSNWITINVSKEKNEK